MRIALRVLLAVFFITIITLLISSSTVTAQEEPPDPYNGLINPFQWDDPSAQTAGKAIYTQKCQGCHGIKGNNFSDSDFSSPDYHVLLETRPDYYYWELSEGIKAKGMPGYASILSEEERWQVLTYIWSLESVTFQETEGPTTIEDGLLRLHLPEDGTAGQPITISATLLEDQRDPVQGEQIEFYIRADFFASGLMEIGKVFTDERGIAEFSYVPRQSGEIDVIARFQNLESRKTITLAAAGESFYHSEVGIKVPVLGDEVLIGPPERLQLGAAGEAPLPVLRLPTGHLAWLAPLVFAAMCIWIVYSYVVFQIFKISDTGVDEEINTKRFSRTLLVVISVLGFLLMVMLLLSPESNPQLF